MQLRIKWLWMEPLMPMLRRVSAKVWMISRIVAGSQRAKCSLRYAPNMAYRVDVPLCSRG